MSRTWLKMIGTGPDRCPEVYDRPYVDFSRRPRRIRRGDRMVLYAVGGSKRIFALAEVTSEVYDSGHERWPHRLNINYLLNLPVSSGVSIDEISTPNRNLRRAIPRSSYFELGLEEYDQASTKLDAASKADRVAE